MADRTVGDARDLAAVGLDQVLEAALDGFAERVVYREFFPRGLTALDTIDETTLGTRPSMGHVTAREEVTDLLRRLKLPLDERGRSTVTLLADHRLLDGVPVARALGALEETLAGPIVAELGSLPRKSAG